MKSLIVLALIALTGATSPERISNPQHHEVHNTAQHEHQDRHDHRVSELIDPAQGNVPSGGPHILPALNSTVRPGQSPYNTCRFGNAPVCATNGFRFSPFRNQCNLESHNFQAVLAGRLGLRQVHNDFCYANCNEIICLAIFQPVCAQQFGTQVRQTLSNSCQINRRICETRRHWYIVRDGACPAQRPSCPYGDEPVCAWAPNQRRTFESLCAVLDANNYGLQRWSVIGPGYCTARKSAPLRASTIPEIRQPSGLGPVNSNHESTRTEDILINPTHSGIREILLLPKKPGLSTTETDTTGLSQPHSTHAQDASGPSVLPAHRRHPTSEEQYSIPRQTHSQGFTGSLGPATLPAHRRHPTSEEHSSDTFKPCTQNSQGPCRTASGAVLLPTHRRPPVGVQHPSDNNHAEIANPSISHSINGKSCNHHDHTGTLGPATLPAHRRHPTDVQDPSEPDLRGISSYPSIFHSENSQGSSEELGPVILPTHRRPPIGVQHLLETDHAGISSYPSISHSGNGQGSSDTSGSDTLPTHRRPQIGIAHPSEIDQTVVSHPSIPHTINGKICHGNDHTSSSSPVALPGHRTHPSSIPEPSQLPPTGVSQPSLRNQVHGEPAIGLSRPSTHSIDASHSVELPAYGAHPHSPHSAHIPQVQPHISGNNRIPSQVPNSDLDLELDHAQGFLDLIPSTNTYNPALYHDSGFLNAGEHNLFSPSSKIDSKPLQPNLQRTRQ